MLLEAERDAVVAQAQALRKTIGFIAFASALFLLLTASGRLAPGCHGRLEFQINSAQTILRSCTRNAVISDRNVFACAIVFWP